MDVKTTVLFQACFLWIGLSGFDRGTAQELEPVVLQLKWHHQFQFAGYYAAVERGYYEEAGMEVRLVEGENVDTIHEVLQGDADFGVALSDLVVAHARGKPVMALATVFQHSPMVLLRKGNPAAGSVHDLAGARVMFEEHSVELDAYLEAVGVDPAGLVRFPYDAPLEALMDGEVDGISAYLTDEPFVFLDRGIPYQVYSPRAAGIDFYGDTLFTSRRVMEARPDFVRRFREASVRGWEYALRHPEEMIDLILERYPENNSRAALEYEARQTGRLIREDLVEVGYMNPGRWRHIAEVYHEMGQISSPPDLKGFLYEEARPYPWKDVLLVVGPVGTVALLSLVIAVYHSRLRRLQAKSIRDLEELDRKLMTLLANMPGIAYRCDNDGGDWAMEFVSHGAYDLTGYSSRELMGKRDPVFGAIIHPDDRKKVGEAVEEANRNHTHFRVRYRIVRKDGAIRWVWEQGIRVERGPDGGKLEGFICDIHEQQRLEDEKDEAIAKLEKALEEIKVLRGIIPICSSCKKIRNDQGGWQQMEAYIRDHSEADFSHGFCPECVRRMYPHLDHDPDED